MRIDLIVDTRFLFLWYLFFFILIFSTWCLYLPVANRSKTAIIAIDITNSINVNPFFDFLIIEKFPLSFYFYFVCFLSMGLMFLRFFLLNLVGIIIFVGLLVCEEKRQIVIFDYLPRKGFKTTFSVVKMIKIT